MVLRPLKMIGELKHAGPPMASFAGLGGAL
jgi:hypothetical protein